MFGISFIFVCLLGMAPSFTQGDEWPSGSYGLPRPKSGCPGGKKNGWDEGWRFQDMEDAYKNTSSRSRASSGTHMDVKFIGGYKDVNRTFCMIQNTRTQTRYWPKGAYCIYKNKDVLCPKNMDTGWVRWDDEDYRNANEKGGFLPDGQYDKDTIIYYCCQTAGHWYDSIELSVSQPFYLLTSSSTVSPKCQMVKWAFSYLEYIVFDTNDQKNNDRQGGNHLFLYGRKLFYCYYEDCRRTMTDPRGSFRSHPTAVSEIDPHSQYCSWLITLAETYVVSLSFNQLNISSCNDSFLQIYDGLNDTAPLLGTYYGSNATTQVNHTSSTNNLYIVSNSGSYARNPGNIFSFLAQYNAVNFTTVIPPIQTTLLSSSAVSTISSVSPSQGEVVGKTDDSSRIIIIATTVGAGVLLSIVLIILLVKLKRKRLRKSSTPVDISLGAVETSPKPFPIDQEPGYEIVANVVATNTHNPEGTPAEVYTELDQNRRRNTADEGFYQKLRKQNSDYVIPAHERRESYKDIKMRRNLPGYAELDQSKREREESQRSAYQKLVKT